MERFVITVEGKNSLKKPYTVKELVDHIAELEEQLYGKQVITPIFNKDDIVYFDDAPFAGHKLRKGVVRGYNVTKSGISYLVTRDGETRPRHYPAYLLFSDEAVCKKSFSMKFSELQNRA